MALNAHPGRHGEPEGTPRGIPAASGGTPPDGAGALDGAVPPEEETLPCGRRLLDVWEAWDAGEAAADPHLAHCPHCSAALADLAALDDTVRRARAEEPDATDGAAELTGRVMDIVRLELRPGRTLPLGAPEEDDWIVEAAAARAFRAAAETVPGVRAGSCRITPVEPPGGGGGTGGGGTGSGGTGRIAGRGPVEVRLEVAAGLVLPLWELAERVRARVAEAARDAIGIDVARVDVRVVDLLDEADHDIHDIHDIHDVHGAHGAHGARTAHDEEGGDR
ncbi:hypothetical protein AB0O07_35185 [Streptomyces sp. NPDC093085]|uniref:hypothetical protein n=1 Tax=Streptomyces sp. NPDC093085 TaxID=3155068 RepID=UPI00343A2B0F